MATTISNRWSWLKNRFTKLPVVVNRVHRIVGALWVLSFTLTAVVSTTGGELPGPSLPGLSIISLVITGSYLLLRPFVRGPATVSDSLAGLTTWTLIPTVVIRRTHRIASALFLLFLAIGLTITAAGGPNSQVILIPVVVLLLYLSLTGLYMLLRPWVNRLRML